MNIKALLRKRDALLKEADALQHKIDERKRLIARYESGASLDQLAYERGVTYQAIQQALEADGIKRRPRGRPFASSHKPPHPTANTPTTEPSLRDQGVTR